MMLSWAASYNAKTGAKVSYQAIGSGGGIKQIKAGAVTFGASDKPLPPDELQAAGLVVVFVNRRGKSRSIPSRPKCT